MGKFEVGKYGLGLTDQEYDMHKFVKDSWSESMKSHLGLEKEENDEAPEKSKKEKGEGSFESVKEYARKALSHINKNLDTEYMMNPLGLKKAMEDIGIKASEAEDVPDLDLVDGEFKKTATDIIEDIKALEDIDSEDDDSELAIGVQENVFEARGAAIKSSLEAIADPVVEDSAPVPGQENSNEASDIKEAGNGFTVDPESSTGVYQVSGESEIKKNTQESSNNGRSVSLGTKDRERTVRGFKRQDLSGIIQRMRGKKNIRYTDPDGKEFFTKYVKFEENKRDNIAGLKNEKRILDLLAESGVTPKTSELKIYPNENRARLIIEQIPGNSLDKWSDEATKEFLKEKADTIIRSTADALNKIHQKNVLLVDVNEGSFLLDIKDGDISTHIVDFELAVDLGKKLPEELESAFRWYAAKDLALNMDREIDHQDAEILKKAEINLWARTLANKMIGFTDMGKSVELSLEKQEYFDSMKTKLNPILEKQIAEKAKKDYESLSKIPKRERFNDLPTEEIYIKNTIDKELPRKIEEELIGITIEEKIKAKGIVVSKSSLDFMSRALDLELKNRPSNFDEFNK